MKEALFLDFDLAHAKDVPELLERSIYVLGLQKPSSVQNRTGLLLVMSFYVSIFS